MKGRVFVSFATAAAISAWGLFAFGSPAYAAGSLVKGSGSAVYYLAEDGNRYVFPNERIYFSWYQDFDAVRTLTDTALAASPLVGNVTYRPGTRLVKLQSVPTVYAVESGGILRPIEDESTAEYCFGAGWNTRIDDLSDAFFPSYKIGDPIAFSCTYPTGTLLRDQETGELMIVKDQTLLPFTAEGIVANRINATQAIETDASVLLERGSSIDGEVDWVSDTAQIGLGTRLASSVSIERASFPDTIFQGNTRQILSAFTISVRDETIVSDPRFLISASTNEDEDEDAGGLVRGDGHEPVETNLDTLILYTSLGFGTFDGSSFFSANLTASEDGDGDQEVVLNGDLLLKPGRHTFVLTTNVSSSAPLEESYYATFRAGNSAWRVDGSLVTDVFPESFTTAEVRVVEPALTFELGDPLKDNVVLGGASVAEAMTFRITNPLNESVTLEDLVLTGFIDEQEGSADFQAGSDADDGSDTLLSSVISRVSLLWLEDGSVIASTDRIGGDGGVAFEAMGIRLSPRTEYTFGIEVEIAPDAPFEFFSDRIAFDIVEEEDVHAWTDMGVRVDASGLEPNNGFEQTLTIAEHGSLIIDGRGSAPERLVMGSENVSLYTFTFTASEEEGMVIDTLAVRLLDPATQGSIESLLFTTEDGLGNAEAYGTNGTFTFTDLDWTIPADKELDAYVRANISGSATGAVSGHEVGIAFEPSEIEVHGAESGWRFTDEEFGEGLTNETEPGDTATVRKNVPMILAAETQVDLSAERDPETPLIRFTISSNGEGTSKIERLAFKISPSDVGHEDGYGEPSDNDLLEILADLNGDTADDNLVAELVNRDTDDVVGEGGDGHVDFSIYDESLRALDETPQGLDTARGDYAVLVYTFTVPLVAYQEPQEYELRLNTDELVLGDQTIRVELLDGEEFLWNDGTTTGDETGEDIDRLPLTGPLIDFN